MSSVFANKKAKILIVDAATAVRQLMDDSLKELGFKNRTSVQGLSEAMDLVGVEEIDWIITSHKPDPNEETSSLHLLKTILAHEQLHNIRVSMICDEDSSDILGLAYEWGLLNHFPRPDTKDKFKSSLQHFYMNFEMVEFDDTKFAIANVRKHLITTGAHKVLLNFEMTLMKMYETDAESLMHYGQALILVGNKEQGETCLWQALMLDPSFSGDINEISERLLGGKSIKMNEDGTANFNALGIESAVLIDPDETVTNAVGDLLEKCGVPSITPFNDAVEAWEYLRENEEPDLIIHEWKMPKVTGPMFIQRIRNNGFHGTCVIVLSNLIEENDAPLLLEMGVTAVAKKPVDNKKILAKITATIQQSRQPSEHKTKEANFYKLLKQKKLPEAKAALVEYMHDGTVQHPNTILMKAEYAFATRKFDVARDGCVEHLKLAGESLRTLHLLGKTLMKLRDFETALRCLQKAQDLSPKNIDRVCSMAEANAELGNEEAADAKLEEAKGLDAGNQRVAEAGAKLALTKGDEDQAREQMESMNNFEEVVAYTNNRAIALCRTGKIQEGLELYNKALASIPATKPGIKAKVLYNAALAQVRADDLEGAVQTLKIVEKGSKKSPDLLAKAKSLRSRLQDSIKNGKVFQLNQESVGRTAVAEKPAEGEEQADTDKTGNPYDDLKLEFDQAHAAILNSLSVQAGSFCCYQMLNYGVHQDPGVAGLANQIAPIELREVIQRGATGGHEKSQKKAG